MAGFGRREIKYMQALCIYDIYIEYYSVYVTHTNTFQFDDTAREENPRPPKCPRSAIALFRQPVIANSFNDNDLLDN